MSKLNLLDPLKQTKSPENNIEIDYDSADKMINVGTCMDVISEKINERG